MASTIRELSTKIQTHLNDGSYSQSITAELLRAPLLTKEDYASLRVFVLILNRTSSQIARGRWSRAFAPVIGIGKQVKYTDLDAVDALDILSEEIEDRMMAFYETTLPTTGWKVRRLQNELDVNQDWLWDNLVYISRITSTWQAITTLS